MSKTLLVSDETYALVQQYAKAADIDKKAAADKLIGTAAGRLASLARYAEKQTGNAPKPRGKKKAVKKVAKKAAKKAPKKATKKAAKKATKKAAKKVTKKAPDSPTTATTEVPKGSAE